MWNCVFFFFFKQKTAYEIVSRDWSSDVCSSDLWVKIWSGKVSLVFSEDISLVFSEEVSLVFSEDISRVFSEGISKLCRSV